MNRVFLAAATCVCLSACNVSETQERERSAKLERQFEQLKDKQDAARVAAAAKKESDARKKADALSVKERSLQHQKSMLQSRLADAEKRVIELEQEWEKLRERQTRLSRSGDGGAFGASIADGMKLATETIPRAKTAVSELKSQISDIDGQLTKVFEEQSKL